MAGSLAVVMTQELILVVMLSTGQNSTDSVRSCGWLPLVSIRMRVKVKGRLKEIKRKEFKSDCLLGILILLILLHFIFQFLFVFVLYISDFFLFSKHFYSFWYFIYYIFLKIFIYKSSFVGPLMLFLRLYLVPVSGLSADLS